MMIASNTKRQRAFTLIEAILVIAVMGIVAGMAAVFIRTPVQSYVDSVGRAEVTDAADLALRRMARDLRLALPNSIRTVGSDGHAIEFLMTKGGGRYMAADDAEADGTSQFILEFEKTNNPNLNKFSVIGAMPSLSQHIMDDLFNYVVVYNLGPGFAPADAYQIGSGNTNIALISGVTKDGAGNVTAITLSSNPFATQNPPMQSPTHRFQVIGGPVMYRCALSNGVYTLTRHWGYTISATAADPPSSGSSAVLASNLASCDQLFSYSNSVNNRRNGLVIMKLALKMRNAATPSISLVDQVHVDNTP
jgi:MSHA biogenesis protein MshO